MSSFTIRMLQRPMQTFSKRKLKNHSVLGCGYGSTITCSKQQRQFSSTSTTSDTPTGSSSYRYPHEPLQEVTVTESMTEDDVTKILQPYFDQQEPVVLRKLLQSSPKNSIALQNFVDWNYWHGKVDASRDCHIEMGGNYSQSQIADVPFVEFLSYLQFFEERFGKRRESQSSNEAPQEHDLIYLAQNDIFPEVLEDIELPSSLRQLGEGHLYSVMIWIGPHGCVSPLHCDPLDNLLMQFGGEKLAYLCSPTSQVHAGSHGNQPNTSPIHPESRVGDNDEDAVVFDDTANLSFLSATLYPGDVLYIPKKWYHYIRTVETSVSVNAWFR